MNFGHPELFSETFDAVLNLEVPFFAKIDDPLLSASTLQYILDIAHLS